MSEPSELDREMALKAMGWPDTPIQRQCPAIRQIAEQIAAARAEGDQAGYERNRCEVAAVNADEMAVKRWRAREKASFALYPILEREGIDEISPGELANAAIEVYENAMNDPLPPGWRKYIINGSAAFAQLAAAKAEARREAIEECARLSAANWCRDPECEREIRALAEPTTQPASQPQGQST